MTTKYPGAIDGYSDIRIVRDGIEEVLARDHNDNRSAVVAIEQTLGIRPQGAHGTVAIRLDQADTDFGGHISGAAHRHVTNHIDYPGSGSHTFQDGYALIPARLGATLDELVTRLGADTPAGSSGGDKIGIASFATEHSKYAFPGTSVRSQILTASAALDENAVLLERALNAFVVDGMSVAEIWGGTHARVAAGHIVSDGRLLRYNGGDLAIPESSTFYIVAQISSGSVLVTVEDTTLPPLDLLNPVVLLHKITRATGAWTESVDIRRFGLFVNDKNFISVGRTPLNGQDGYGCDFLSLKGAVEYARALATLDKFITPRKIVLVNDIMAIADADIDILLDATLEGIEIDGCGKSLILDGGFTLPIFQINTNQVRIHDLTVLSAASVAPTCFAHVGATTQVSDVQIVRCGIKTQPGFAPVEKFLLLGEATGAVTVSDMLIANNTVSVADGGIVYADLTASYMPILFASKIVGNRIYQDTVVTTLFPAIQASAECVVSDNIINGGFATGIGLHAPIDTVVSDNLIIGTNVLLPPPPWADPPPLGDSVMDTGIATWVPGGVGNTYGALITHNTIKGAVTCGIDVAKTGVAGRQTILSDNIINNNVDVYNTSAIGIKVDRYEVPVVNNTIIGVGNPIVGANFVIGNIIYGHGIADPGAENGILCVPGPMAIVCNNHIYDLDCSGSIGASAININGSDGAIVSGNVVRECIGTLGAGITIGNGTQAVITGNVISHTSTTNGMWGITRVGHESIVCNNAIIQQEHGAFAANLAGADKVSFIGNRAHNCNGPGISMDNVSMATIVDNVLIGGPNASNGIYGFASGSVVCGNTLIGYGYGGGCPIDAPCAYGPLSSAIVSNNLIYEPHGNMTAAIAMTDSVLGAWFNIVVTDNVVYATASGSGYRGIDVSGATNAIISGNLLSDSSGSGRSGIYRVGQFSVVANNAVLGYGNGGIDNVGISLMDAYSSAVVGNTITAGPDLTYGILLDGAANVDNLIANNVLNGLRSYGVELGVLHFGTRNIVSGNIIVGMNSGANAAGISNLCSQSMAIGNNISYANGDGIRAVPGWVALLSTWTGSAIVGNMVNDPDAYGIHVNQVGGLLRLDGYSDLNGCLVSGNHVASTTAHHGGIYLSDTWRSTITGNYVKNFDVGIWLLGVSQGCIDNLVCGNNVQQDPVMGVGTTGIWVDAGCTSNHIVGNFVFGPVVGIRLDANLCSICSNHVIWARGTGIDAAGTIDVGITGNYVGPGYPLSLWVDGINVFGCRKTLVTGNLAFGYLLGMSFRVNNAQPADGLVMSGNLARDGWAAPYQGDGLGGLWNSGKITDIDCRHITP